MTPERAVYAANVNHYNHVVEAMNVVFDEVALYRNWKPTPKTIARLRRAGVPEVVVATLARRARDEDLGRARVVSLGPAQFAHPMAAKLGLPVSGALHRKIIASTAARVASDRGGAVLQFVEGLGYLAIRRGRFANYICERRNLHQDVFAEPLDLLGGFPMEPKKDPIDKVLTEEYDAADRIIVYSEVAARSFIQRGYSREQISVIPLALPDQLERVQRPRNPFQLAYVGRGDAYKGLDVAVEATRLLGGAYRLSVAGPMPPTVRRWLASKSWVDNRGILGRRELRDLYSSSSVLLAPSVESFGLAIFEALHHGCPVITRETTGISDYIPLGLRNVVEGRNPESWAAAIENKLGGVEDTVAHEQLVDSMASTLTWDSASASQRRLFDSLV